MESKKRLNLEALADPQSNSNAASYKHFRKMFLKRRLRALSEDLVQAMAGEEIADIESRRAEFVTLHNELRVLEGKAPRPVAADEGGETV